MNRDNFNLEEAEKVVKGINIPPRPKLLAEINAELQKADADVNKVANGIAKDVGLSASILKVMNSPFYGLRTKIGSIPHAVQLLGINNVKHIITGLMLKNALGGESQALERFWDSSEKVAKISAYIASLLPKVPRDEVYTFGLFRECGVPLLMQRLDDYKQTLQIAGGGSKPMTMIEDERHGTNHAVVGYMVAKTWKLPETISEAILRHHDYEMLSDSSDCNPMVYTLVSINYLAEFLNDEMLRMRDNAPWRFVGGAVLDHLGITSDEFNELKQDITTIVQQ